MKTSTLAAVLIALAPGAAGAEDATGKIDISVIDLTAPLLDLSVEAVTRRIERASEAPASVTVITADDIRRNGFRTVNELLGSVPGLFSYPGTFPQTGVRGMGVLGDFTTRLLVLLDGHSLMNSLGNDLGRGVPVPLAAIRRVEVIKGPVGSVYGPSAFLGVVNLVTTGGPPGGELLLGAEPAQRALRAGEASAIWRGGEAVDALVSADVYGGHGLDWTYPELAPLQGVPGVAPGGTKTDVDSPAAANAYARLHWRTADLAASCARSEGGMPAATIFADTRTRIVGGSCFAEAALDVRLAEGLTVRPRLAFDYAEQRAAFGLPPPPQGIGVYRHDGHDAFSTAEVRADWRASEALRVDAGGTLQLHRMGKNSYSNDIPGSSVILDKDYATVNTWLGGQLRLGSVTFHGGLTYFEHSVFGGRATPKLAAVWQATPADTVKAIWSLGFRPPTMIEAFLQDRFTFLANPDLKAETVRSAELAYEHRMGDVASVAASFFWNEYRDLIRFVTVPLPGLGRAPDPSNPADFREIAQNADALRLLGGELSLTLRFRDLVQAYGGLSVQGVDQANRPNFPTLTGNLSVSSRAAWRPLLLAVRGSVISSRSRASTLGSGPTERVPAAVSLAAVASLDVPGVPGLQVELSAVNLLDARNDSPAPFDFGPITALPEDARTLRADLRWRF